MTRVYQGQPKKEEYLLVDGYNVIFAWEELSALSKVTLDGARGRLLDILCDYQAMKGCRLIVVFDAYRLKGHPEEAYAYHNIYVVYTKEAETADRYIERFAHDNSKKYQITGAGYAQRLEMVVRISGKLPSSVERGALPDGRRGGGTAPVSYTHLRHPPEIEQG